MPRIAKKTAKKTTRQAALKKPAKKAVAKRPYNRKPKVVDMKLAKADPADLVGIPVDAQGRILGAAQETCTNQATEVSMTDADYVRNAAAEAEDFFLRGESRARKREREIGEARNAVRRGAYNLASATSRSSDNSDPLQIEVMHARLHLAQVEFDAALRAYEQLLVG